ncbi:MAG: ABC transporter permease [Tannerella sp.]|jgi:putative ABC transport system permease protein|nr:ABC transporter permease [Tannerella sp.]
MFEFDNLIEIWGTIKKNKLRTTLTGFAIAWGIFMLIILLSAGNGLRNGIAYNFRYMADNTVYCWSRYTTKPYKGYQANRSIEFDVNDLYAIKRENPEVDLISATNFRNDTLTYNKEFLIGSIEAVHPDFASIIYAPIQSGRFINAIDIMDKRKVIVLPQRMIDILFRDTVKQVEPLGRFIKVGNLMFQVVGIYKEQSTSDSPTAYIPFATGQALYDDGYRIQRFTFTLKGVDTEAASIAFEEHFRGRMARRHNFDPTDTNPVGMYNSGNEFRMWQGMNNGIALFIWIIGVGTLMAGIVGVSNIMLISVRERTKEFGIRKAIGAKPSSILRLIIIESLIVTAVFGYVGMMAGIGLTEMINFFMEQAADAAASSGMQNTTVFRNPTVDLGTTVSATIVLVIAGVVAGYFPARKAVKISAVEAMRTE